MIWSVAQYLYTESNTGVVGGRREIFKVSNFCSRIRVLSRLEEDGFRLALFDVFPLDNVLDGTRDPI